MERNNNFLVKSDRMRRLVHEHNIIYNNYYISEYTTMFMDVDGHIVVVKDTLNIPSDHCATQTEYGED